MTNYLSKKNVFEVADKIYKQIGDKYDVNIQGYYLEDIQKVMGRLWEKNKNKKLRKNQNIIDLYNALNKKAVELLIPQVSSSIEGGYLNQKNNIMFSPKNNYENAQNMYQLPKSTNDNKSIDDAYQKIQMDRDSLYPKQEKVNFNEEVPNYQDTNELYEKMKKDRESTESLNTMLGVPHNKYSSENVQNKKITYENTLPNTENIMKNVEEFNKNYQTMEYFNQESHPSSFSSNNMEMSNINEGGSMTNQMSNGNIETNLYNENNDVNLKFLEQKELYEQNLRYNQEQMDQSMVKDSSNVHHTIKKKNYIDDVVNKKEQKNKKHALPEDNLSGIEGISNNILEGFKIEDPANKVVKNNRVNAEKDLVLNNLLSDNINIDYPLIAQENSRYITRKYYLSVDSLQRDLENYPLPTYFQVRFEQPDEELEVPSYLNQNGVVIYERPVLFQNVGGKGAKMENIYENIIEIKCLDAQIPFDRIFIGGTSPYIFNGPKIDQNRENPLAFGSFPYGPIWNENYGVEVDILDEPFYYLVVDEIDGAYDGTNLASRRALAKLNYDKIYGSGRKFLNLRTTNFEGKIFYPTNLAKLSQMTLRFVTRFSRLLDVGVDKIYVEKVEEGEEVPDDGKFCPLLPGQHLTKITIISDDPEYGQEICSHNNVPGDRLLFYSIFNCDPFSQYTKLSKNIYIKFLSESGYENLYKIYFFMVHGPELNLQEKKIDPTTFLRENDLLIINNKFMFDIVRFVDGGFNMLINPRTPYDPEEPITHKGFIRVKKSGNNNENKASLLYEAGHRVGGKLDERFTFQILYPYECVPDYLKSPVYKPKELFYIHAKKQITYTFQVTQVEKNMESLDSRIIASQ